MDSLELTDSWGDSLSIGGRITNIDVVDILISEAGERHTSFIADAEAAEKIITHLQKVFELGVASTTT